MADTNFLFKTWYEDARGWKHHLYVEQFLGADNNVFYHCTIDGTKKLDIELIEEKWEDVARLDGELADKIGNIIEKHTY